MAFKGPDGMRRGESVDEEDISSQMQVKEKMDSQQRKPSRNKQ